MLKMFHVFSEGENVLFREDGDYIYFSNRFASSSHALRLQVLALTTMSTHFHALIETSDESAVKELDVKLRKAYGLYYKCKYGYSLGNAFRISHVEVTTREAALNELLYVMRNPVHHYVCSYPFEYPYSSASYIFTEQLIPPAYLSAFRANVTTVGELSYRQRRLVEGTDPIPDEWEVLNKTWILPSSFINIPRVRAFWNNKVKAFMFSMNQNQTDAKKETISADILDLRSDGLSDVQVCQLIDAFSTESGAKSFHYLDELGQKALIRSLKHQAVPNEQIKRCLWL